MMAKKMKNILDTTGMPVIAPAGKPILSPEQISEAIKQPAWNPPTQNKTETSQPTPQISSQPKIIRDQNTRKITGIELPDGRTLLGISPAEVRFLAAKEAGKLATPPGAVEASTLKANENIALEAQTAASQIGNLTPEQQRMIQGQGEAPIDWKQALTAGTIGAGPSILTRTAGGAVAGAAAGSVVPGFGTVAGGIVGGAVGGISAIYSGVTSNIKKQQGGNIAETQNVLSSAKTNMRQLAILAAKDPTHADEYVDAYNQQLANVYAAQSRLKLETQGNLNKWMDDGTEKLSDFEIFLEPGGLADLYGAKLKTALVVGGAVEFTAEDLMEEVTE